MQLESQLIKRHACGLGGGAELEEKIAKQSVAPLMAGLLIDNDQFQRHRGSGGVVWLARLKRASRRLKRRRSYSGNSRSHFGAGHAQRCRRETTSPQDSGSRGVWANDTGRSGDWRDAAFGQESDTARMYPAIPWRRQAGVAAALTFGVAECVCKRPARHRSKGQTVSAWAGT